MESLNSYLAGQRAEQLAAVAGARKRLYFMRERILELGPVGESYLTELIHARPRTWKGDVERLFMLLEELGEPTFLRMLQRHLGHKHVKMTMKYATFHPGYNDVAPHFERMGQMLGLYDDEEWDAGVV